MLRDLALDRLGPDVPCPKQERLLADHEQVRDGPIQDESRRQGEADEGEHQRHHPQDRLLLLGGGPRRADALHLELLEERRADHQHEQRQIGDLCRDARAAVVRVRRDRQGLGR